MFPRLIVIPLSLGLTALWIFAAQAQVQAGPQPDPPGAKKTRYLKQVPKTKGKARKSVRRVTPLEMRGLNPQPEPPSPSPLR